MIEQNIMSVFKSSKNAKKIVNKAFDGIFIHYSEKLFMAYRNLDKLKEEIGDVLEYSGLEHLENALEKGKVVLITGHLGAVEFLPLALHLRNYPVSMTVSFQNEKLKKNLTERAAEGDVEIIDCYDNISEEVTDESIQENIDFIKNFVSETKISKVVVGWGNIVSEIPYLKRVSSELMELLNDFNIDCIDITQKGNPYSASPMAINRNFGGILNVKLKPFKPKVVEYDLMKDLDIILKTVKNILDNQ